MSTNVEIPPLGESVKEAVLTRWLKGDGERVSAAEPIAELETDKANVDLPAPAAGVLRRAKEEGETVQVGETIARIDDAGTAAAAAAAPTAKPATPSPEKSTPEKSSPAPSAPAAAPEGRSPAVRRLVEENKLDPATIPATGRGGRLTKSDVLQHIESRPTHEPPPPQQQPPAPPPAPPPVAVDLPAHAPSMSFDNNGVRRVPMSKIRKRIAERLVQAQQTAAILTTFNEIDMSAVLGLREKYKDRFAEVHGVSLGLMSFFARGCVLALHKFPHVNAEVEGSDIVYHEHVHLGIAVSTDRGLAVPVLRGAEAMSFGKIESEIKRLAKATRDGKLSMDELSGGTFTITNGGVFGSLLSTPILNPPQSGILGMHAIQKRPVAVGDEIEVRPMMYVALSYDHRLVDGKESVSFLVRVKQLLEDPARLMLEV